MAHGKHHGTQRVNGDIHAAGSVHVTDPTIIEIPLPALIGIRTSGTGTLTPSIIRSTGRTIGNVLNLRYFTSGGGAKSMTVDIPIPWPHTVLGRRVTILDQKLTIAKTQSTAGVCKIDSVSLTNCTGTDDSIAIVMNAVVTDGTDRLSGAAVPTPTTWTTGYADTQLVADGELFLTLVLSHDGNATSQFRIYLDSNHTQLTINTVN
jgi:hypothetical protein